MIIIGIDPSMANTALVAMDLDTMKVLDSLLIETVKSTQKQVRVSSDTISRCRDLISGTSNFLDGKGRYIIAGETPSGSKNSAAMKGYGISCFLLALYGALEVTPDEVKKATVGSGTASKEQMIAWAMEKHPEAPWEIHKSGKHEGKPLAKMEHMADAIGVIYAAMKLPEFKRLRGAYNQ